jgi:hypothetical protein
VFSAVPAAHTTSLSPRLGRQATPQTLQTANQKHLAAVLIRWLCRGCWEWLGGWMWTCASRVPFTAAPRLSLPQMSTSWLKMAPGATQTIHCENWCTVACLHGCGLPAFESYMPVDSLEVLAPKHWSQKCNVHGDAADISFRPSLSLTKSHLRLDPPLVAPGSPYPGLAFRQRRDRSPTALTPFLCLLLACPARWSRRRSQK